jgi:exopolysaccharide biosynthesis polyprenyl glycosylphosphotransferase
MRSLRERGALSYRTLVVGSNGEARRLAEVLSSGGTGFRVIGCVSTKTREAPADRLRMLGRVGDLPKVIRRTGADCVFVASTAVNLEEMWAVSRVARREHVELRMSANLPGVAAARLSLRPLGDVLTLALQPLRLTRRQIAAKRAFDLVGAGILLVLVLPAWAGVAAAIRLSSGGPVLYRQERVGRDGRPFRMLKFRTMHEGAEALAERLRAVNGSSHPLFKMPGDPRVTTVGRWLRRWSLDEVPQLLNVLRGEMSLVGPRPPLPRELAAYEERHRDRLEMTPGITGLWQVSGRSNLNFEESVRLDVYYVQNWSILLDLYILARTVPAVLSGRGAY